MLTKIEFKYDYRCFKKCESIKFNQLTLLVGDQGCGKSTVFQCLNKHAYDTKNSHIIVECKDQMNMRSFDFEQDSPRVTEPGLHDSSDVFTTKIMQRFLSHGQSINTILSGMNEFDKGSLILLDEPDMALSIRSIYKLIDIFKSRLADGCQIISTCHNPLLISAFHEVMSLEHRKWMTSKEFIELESRC